MCVFTFVTAEYKTPPQLSERNSILIYKSVLRMPLCINMKYKTAGVYFRLHKLLKILT